MNWIKLGISIFGVAVILLGAAVGYGDLKKGQEVTEKKIEKIEPKVEKNKNVNIEQTTILAHLVKQIEKNSERDEKNNDILNELIKKVYEK